LADNAATAAPRARPGWHAVNAVTEEREFPDPVPPRAADPNAPRVRTLLICDLADSTALVERLGDGPAAELIRRHDRVARDLLQRFRGREIDKTDGFLALFERPVEAVGFALHYQRALRQLGQDAKQVLRARVGIHVGEVVLWENTRAEIDSGAKPVEVEGLAKPVVARLMALALPGQVLLSGVAFTLAQRAEKELEARAPLRWLTHGRYHFKGVPAPMLVHEVGESDLAPLHAPPSGPKAQRDVPLWRRPGVLALEAIALLAAIAIPSWLSLRAPPAIAFGERDWVVMGELRNLTGETLLDDSLATAFRISLEQSRHVNVLPDLKLRDALARMQRPADTAIDRAVASEIALREGARAVILPTVAEVGGRVRVSAEVVDPHTQTTVYAESADGVGAVSALDSIDTVTQELRARLGEALAAIEQDSSPLPQVTSANLDALRAYALGYNAYLKADFTEALALYRQALALDAGFAQAKVGIARVHLAGSDTALARRHLEQALVDRERLPPREILYVEALRSVLEYRADYLDRWRSLIAVYPDFFPSYYNFALFARHAENRYEEPIAVARRGLDTRNPAFGVLHYLIGTLELGRDDLGAATTHLERARIVGGDASRRVWIGLHAARRDFAAAQAAVGELKASGLASNEVSRHLTIAAFEADRSGPAIGIRTLAAAAAEAQQAGPLFARVLAGAELGLLELDPDAGFAARLEAFIEQEADAGAAGDVSERPHAAFALAWASGVAHRWGRSAAADRAAATAGRLMEGLHYPVVDQLLAVAAVQRALRAGDLAGARAALPDTAVESVLLETLQVEIELLRAEGRRAEALRAAGALEGRRGRAYAEFGSNYLLLPRNVAQTTLVLLTAAELAAADGQRDAAASHLARFEERWETGKQGAHLQARIAQLRRQLAPSDPRPP
jgi:putative peptide modification system cyclase